MFSSVIGWQGEEVTVANMGRAVSGPTIESDGQLLLTYKDGDTCTKTDGTNTTYTTKIHLRCQRGQLVSLSGWVFCCVFFKQSHYCSEIIFFCPPPPGAVAELVERRLCIPEVGSLVPGRVKPMS